MTIPFNFIETTPHLGLELQPDNPWLVRLCEDNAEFLSAVAELLPGSGVDPMKGKYAALRRAGWVTPYGGEELLAQNIREVAQLAASISRGFAYGEEWADPPPPEDWHVGEPSWYGPITFGVDHDGSLVHHDGKHRTSLLWATGQPVPARIVARHPRWFTLANSMPDLIYDESQHPDFIRRPTVRKNSRLRFGRAARWLRDQGAESVVDIGGYLGQWAAVAQHAGLAVETVEASPVHRQLARHHLAALDLPCVHLENWNDSNADAVSAFSSLQHVARTVSELERVVCQLVRFRLVLIELPLDDEPIWTARPRPASRVHQWLHDAGYRSQVLYVDRAHLNRRTIAYRRPDDAQRTTPDKSVP